MLDKEKLRIYFAASMKGEKRKDTLYWNNLITERLRTHGTLLTEQVVKFSDGEQKEPHFIYQRDIEWLKSCNVFVASVSEASLGVGYEIAKAEEFGKRILCLYRGDVRRLSAMILGNPNIITKAYQNKKELYQILDLIPHGLWTINKLFQP